MAEEPEVDKKGSIGRRMGLAALLLSGSILLSRVLGFVREAVIAYLHGAGEATDAYYAAFTLPDLMSYFLTGGTLSITFIPMFSAYLARGDEEGGWKLFSTVATTMGALLLLATVAFEALAPYAVAKLNPGFVESPEQLDLAITMTRIVIPAQLAIFFGGLLNATNYSREIFWPAALAPLVYNLCIIVGGVALNPWFGIQGFAVGVLAGAFLGPFGVPLLAAWRNVRFQFHFSLKDPGFRRFVVLTLPLVLGVSLVTVDDWFLKYFGSMEADGAISWLTNSRKLMLVVFAVVGQAAGQAALPFLTRLYHEGKEAEMGVMLSRSLQRVLFLAAIGAFGLAVAAEPIVFIIFQRGAFTVADAEMTSTLLVCFALGLTAWSAQTLAVRGFYARQDTLTPMIVGTVIVGVSLPIYFLLVDRFDVVGLALASSIAMTLSALTTIVVYRIRAGHLPFGPLLKGLGRGVTVGVLAAAAAWGTRLGLERFIEPDGLLSWLGLGVGMGIPFFVVVLGLSTLANFDEIEMVTSRLKRLVKRLMRRTS